MTKRSAGRKGEGGGGNTPTNGYGNRQGKDGFGEDEPVDPPTTRGDGPGVPGVTQGTQTEQGGNTEGEEWARDETPHN